MSNRNSDARFANVPYHDIKRSKFNIPFTHKTTFNAGEIVPFFIELDVLPGDTFTAHTSAVIRMSTPIWPTMDNCFADIYYFYTANRLSWNHWKDFMGENRNGAWTQLTEYTVPKLTTPTGGAATGTIMDYMGIPINVAGITFNALPIRHYVLIYNEWFRDQNFIAPYSENKDDTTRTASNIDPTLGGRPFKAAKFHDYFTSCLPEPQKGSAVTMPLGTMAPVMTNGALSGSALQTTGAAAGSRYDVTLGGTTTTGPTTVISPRFNGTNIAGNSTFLFDLSQNSSLYADLTGATAATFNALRLAGQTQRILERDARCGTRYTEIIKAHFNVHSPDARQQRPEYLGGQRLPININQVLQTSATSQQSPQGNAGAYSLTGDSQHSFTKSFTEHGTIIGLVVVRTDQTYQQGLERGWSRSRRLDYFWPTLAHIGEQPRYNREIYAQGTNVDDEVFGYQEAWAEYRYKPARTSGQFRSTSATPLDSWHYAIRFNSLPVLSQAFLEQGHAEIDRTLAVTSQISNQFIADFLVDMTVVRPMPVYSVPGMLDHF